MQEAEREADRPRGDSIGTLLQMPLSWLENAWKNTSNRQSLCEHQELPIGFIAQRWCNMNTLEQRTCCQYQKFTPEFLKAFWIHIHPHHRLLCYTYQQVPIEIIKECWDDMNDIQRMICTSKQHYFDQLSPGELPEHLTSGNWRMRRAAMKSMTKHAQKEKLKNGT